MGMVMLEFRIRSIVKSSDIGISMRLAACVLGLKRVSVGEDNGLLSIVIGC